VKKTFDLLKLILRALGTRAAGGACWARTTNDISPS
jgi:hypothetical protein